MKAKRQLAARILKTSSKKIKVAPGAGEEVKKAITRSDIRGLIAVGKLIRVRPSLQSRVRARKIAVQKSKGRMKGQGKKKGAKYSKVNKKQRWMAKVRSQRAFLNELREKKIISGKDYRALYSKSSGGYFRNIRHIKLFITEHKMGKE